MACISYSVQGQPSQLSKTQPKKVEKKLKRFGGWRYIYSTERYSTCLECRRLRFSTVESKTKNTGVIANNL